MPILTIGIDSVDTRLTGCTTHYTYLLVKILNKKLKIQLADYPWLVRLNPAIPWKTRGNAATVLHIYSNTTEAEKITKIVRETIKTYTINRNRPAYIILLSKEHDDIREYYKNRPKQLVTLYERTVHEAIDKTLALKTLKEIKVDAIDLYGIERRSIIGAVASLGMNLADYTYELITYRKPDNINKERKININTIIDYDLRYRPYTFMNYDYELNKQLIAPHGSDPILYGVRGERADIVEKALKHIEVYEEIEGWLIYRTNQATNQHLKRKNIQSIHPYDNPILRGKIRRKRKLRKTHLIATFTENNKTIKIAAYRETKNLQKIIEILPEDIEAEVGGQIKPHTYTGELTLNTEYIKILQPTPTLPLNNIITPPLSSYHHLMKPPERKQSKKNIEQELPEKKQIIE